MMTKSNLQNSDSTDNHIRIALTAASYSGNKGAAAMLQSSVAQLYDAYGDRLMISLMSVYPDEDIKLVPYKFIDVIPCRPAHLVFLAFPLAILYRLFRLCPPVRFLLRVNRVIRTYSETDVVIDEAGISFVDSRGLIMNTYAFICASVPLLIGTPVIKYSQALGPFKNAINRVLGHMVLPKLELICARGEITRQNLAEIGIIENVKVCADGAFTMKDDPVEKDKINNEIKKSIFYDRDIVGLSVSSVVHRRCIKRGIDYVSVMVEFIEWLNFNGYGVHIIANAARTSVSSTHNNDLPIGDEIYSKIKDTSRVRWDSTEMTPEAIREYISHCRYLIASRFHSMIGALTKGVPAFLIGWSHKYIEVMDMFELGDYVIDYSNLNQTGLREAFLRLTREEHIIRNRICEHWKDVEDSSYNNIRYAVRFIDEMTGVN